MAYEQAGGPSTPDRGGFASFGRPYESFEQQQKHSSGFGRETTSNSSPFESSLTKNSSLRKLSSGPSTSGFVFGGMREMSTPKSVRWEDAQSTPAPQQPVAASAAAPSSQYLPPSQFPFSLQYSGKQQQQSLQLSQPQSQASAGMQQFQPWSSSNPGPQNQQTTTTPNTSFQRSFSSSFSLTGPSQSQIVPSASSQSVQPTRSAFNNTSSSNAPNIAPLAITRPSQKSNPASTPPLKSSDKVIIASRPAIVSRIKWNVAALLLAWFIPRFGIASRLYW